MTECHQGHKGQAGQKNFIGFLAELDHSDSFGKISFFGLFGLLAFIKAKRPKIFVVCPITFNFASNKQIKIFNLYSNVELTPFPDQSKSKMDNDQMH